MSEWNVLLDHPGLLSEKEADNPFLKLIVICS